jgi:hypothetical protein
MGINAFGHWRAAIIRAEEGLGIHRIYKINWPPRTFEWVEPKLISQVKEPGLGFGKILSRTYETMNKFEPEPPAAAGQTTSSTLKRPFPGADTTTPTTTIVSSTGRRPHVYVKPNPISSYGPGTQSVAPPTQSTTSSSSSSSSSSVAPPLSSQSVTNVAAQLTSGLGTSTQSKGHFHFEDGIDGGPGTRKLAVIAEDTIRHLSDGIVRTRGLMRDLVSYLATTPQSEERDKLVERGLIEAWNLYGEMSEAQMVSNFISTARTLPTDPLLILDQQRVDSIKAHAHATECRLGAIHANINAWLGDPNIRATSAGINIMPQPNVVQQSSSRDDRDDRDRHRRYDSRDRDRHSRQDSRDRDRKKDHSSSSSSRHDDANVRMVRTDVDLSVDYYNEKGSVDPNKFVNLYSVATLNTKLLMDSGCNGGAGGVFNFDECFDQMKSGGIIKNVQ